MNAMPPPGLPSGTATNVAPSGRWVAIRALPKLNDERPGTTCDDVFDTRHVCAVDALLPTASVARQASTVVTSAMPKASLVTYLVYER